MVERDNIMKLTYFINAMLLVFVIGMGFVFARTGVTYMVYHSIPTAILYVIYFFIVRKGLLDIYTLVVYITITIYMIATTICIGYNAGFHLYCMSLIPLTFYMKYLGHKLNTRCMNPMYMSFTLIAAYLIGAVFVIIRGPIYEVNSAFLSFFMIFNALAVFYFLITFSRLSHKMILDSESKLSDMAHMDQLTGLYNRRYIISHLDELEQYSDPRRWIALVDIDDFKHINDRYGHNCGDYVLVEVSRIMKEVCRECVIARWGGEEFLIATRENFPADSLLEELRAAVERAPLSFQGTELTVTITVGVSHHQANQTLDGWIQDADAKMYEGKNSGKNRVIR